MAVFLRWFLLFVLIIVGSVIAFISGGVNMVLDGDVTKISVIVTVITFGMTLLCGYNSFTFARLEDGENDKAKALRRGVATGRFAASACSRLGLLGTVVGFIMMLGGLTSFKIGDPIALQNIVSSMSDGMSVALYTTLVGQAANLLISAQYHNLKQGLGKAFNE